MVSRISRSQAFRRRITWFVLSLASAGLVGTALATDGKSAGAVADRSCSSTSVPAIVRGQHRCLRRFSACRPQLNTTYHRYLFHCSDGYLDFWWTGLARRSLRVPTLAAGSPCPATEADGTLGERGTIDASAIPAFGPGPAYPALGPGPRAAVEYAVDWGPEGWGGLKLLWSVPRYYGPYLVRGRQLDGPNVLKFDQGPDWTFRLHNDLRLAGPNERLNPAATFLRSPGCYAYQVDGRGFSYLIVFEAHVAS